MNQVLALQRLLLGSDDSLQQSVYSVCCEGSTQSQRNCCNTQDLQ